MMRTRPLASMMCLLIGVALLPGCASEVGEPQNDGNTQDDGGSLPDDRGAAQNDDAALSRCVIPEGESLDSSGTLGCEQDFEILASEPLDASIPGARSVKTVIDRADGDKLYFQNSVTHAIHWDFARARLSGSGLPIVPSLSDFNETEYFSPSRRFLLGAVTFYQEPGVWAYEIAPYDTASAEMIGMAYDLIAESSFFGTDLYFHPNSETVESEAASLAPSVKIISTDELFAGIDYQALHLGVTLGKLRFFKADGLEDARTDFRDIVVLDAVPNDISVVIGIITAEFQTPLSHINVLSQNRGTPNMALRGALENGTLLALEDRWVRLEVGAFQFSIVQVTKDEADAWWQLNKPDAVTVPALDLSVTDLRDIEDVLDPALELGDALEKAIPAFGGKASHYGGLALIGDDVPAPKAFAVPVYYYWQFMEQNGFNDVVADLIADEAFQDDPRVREQRLEELRDDMKSATVDPEFGGMLLAKLEADYPGVRMRFRSSTNAEDLDGFTGAGLYNSKTGDPNDPDKPVLDAVRKVWASVWKLRAFEERSFRSINHQSVGMALLVHRSFPDEEANGVALTANIFDTSGLQPGFYINVQIGEESVVRPEPGVVSDQFVYQFDFPGQPTTFIAHSTLVPAGATVLTNSQRYDLGVALKAIHEFFKPVYGTDPLAWYGMDVEFKFDGAPGEEPALFVKQARPHPGW